MCLRWRCISGNPHDSGLYLKNGVRLPFPHFATILVEQALIQGRIPFDLIFDEHLEDLSKYKALVLARNGKLYGVGGEDDGMAQLFCYDPAGGTCELLGMIDVNRRPFYSWQAYVIDCAALGTDGTVYLGQSERKSKPYLCYPEP